ncbi:MAG: LLM class flavin-dependent oxidoreductase [Salinirussus sp.]
MRIATGLPSFSSPSHSIPPDRFRRYARAADEREYAGAYVIEHLAESPSYASSLLDPLTTITYAAGETETLPMGTSVLLLPLRNPVMFAKRAVTAQHLAGRRLTFGLGTGYVESEFEAVGVPMEERGARYREALALIRRLFTEDRVTFDGEFYGVEEFRLEPQLGQPPRLLAGGDGAGEGDDRTVPRGVLARMNDADGWIAPPRSVDKIAADLADIEGYLEERNRNTDTFDRVALQYVHLVPGADDKRSRREQRRVFGYISGEDRSVDARMDRCLTGTIEAVQETLAEYARLGFDEVICHPMATEPNELDRQLRLIDDHLAAMYR